MERTKLVKKQEEKIREYLEKPYARMFFPEEEGGYSAMILEFQGCLSEGDTIEEALSNLEEAAGNWLKAALGKKLSIPPPSSSITEIKFCPFCGKALGIDER